MDAPQAERGDAGLDDAPKAERGDAGLDDAPKEERSDAAPLAKAEGDSALPEVAAGDKTAPHGGEGGESRKNRRGGWRTESNVDRQPCSICWTKVSNTEQGLTQHQQSKYCLTW